MKIRKTNPFHPPAVLVLDVSLRHTGWALWHMRLRRFAYSGVISPPSIPRKELTTTVTEDNVRRYKFMAAALARLLREHCPRLILAELPHGGAQSSRAAAAMAAASAVITTAATIHRVPLYLVQPAETKRLIRAHGEVSKEEVQKLVSAYFGLSLPDDSSAEHVADAMATILVARKRGWPPVDL